MSLGPIILVSCVGTTTGYSAILLPQLKDANSTITVTQEESSWIGIYTYLHPLTYTKPTKIDFIISSISSTASNDTRLNFRRNNNGKIRKKNSASINSNSPTNRLRHDILFFISRSHTSGTNINRPFHRHDGITTQRLRWRNFTTQVSRFPPGFHRLQRVFWDVLGALLRNLFRLENGSCVLRLHSFTGLLSDFLSTGVSIVVSEERPHQRSRRRFSVVQRQQY